MRELMEEEELLCMDDLVRSDSVTANFDLDPALVAKSENTQQMAKRGYSVNEDYVTASASLADDENILHATPSIVFCRDVDTIAALVKKWRAAKKYAILFEPDPLEPFLLPPIGVFLAFNDDCVYFMRLRAKSRDDAGNEMNELPEHDEEVKPSCDIATVVEILRDESSKKMTIDLKAQLRSLLSTETFEDHEPRLKPSASLQANSFKHCIVFCGENVFDLRIMAWLLHCDVQTTPCVSSVNAWGSSRMLRRGRGNNDGEDDKGSKILLHSSSMSIYETSLCDAILRAFISDLSDTLNVSKIEKQSTYDPKAKINRHRNKISVSRLDLAKSVATIWHVSDVFEDLCKRRNVFDTLVSLEMPFVRTLADIENAGVSSKSTSFEPEIARAKLRREEI